MLNTRSILVAATVILSLAPPRLAGPAVSLPEIPWDIGDASIAVVDDGDLEYTMPFTFPFFGRDIVKIDVNTNGLIELLEAGESCVECDDYNTHDDGDHVSGDIDAVFAANDDLITGVIVEGFSDSVEVIWHGRTLSDSSFEFDSIAYKVILFDDGRVQWKFFDMDYSGHAGDLFSGVYDELEDREFEVPGGSTSFTGRGVERAFEFDPAGSSIASIPWDPADAGISASDDVSLEYTLPFGFPFFGRTIVKLSVNTNGLVELLEAGESCLECSSTNTHSRGAHVTKDIDAIFAANDDLRTSVMIEGFPDLVEVIWSGTTFRDDDYESRPVAFKVVLLSDGTMRWKFFDMDYSAVDTDLFSGMYDEVDDVEYEVSGGSRSFSGAGADKAFEFVGTPQTTTTTTSTTTTTLPPPDHFLCYKAKPTKRTPKFEKLIGVGLADQFEDKKFDVIKPFSFCNPADKKGEGIGDPNTHLEGYLIKRGKVCSDDNSPCTSTRNCAEGASCDKQAKHVRQSRLLVSNQLGEIVVDTVKPLSLLLPAAKDLDNPVAPLDPASHAVDHFKCYKIKLHKKVCLADRALECRTDAECAGAGPCFLRFPKGLRVSLDDQFMAAPKLFEVKKPVELCTPADKNDEGIKNPDAHLLCYKITLAKGRCAQDAPANAGGACKKETDCGGEKKVTAFCVLQPRFEKLVGIHVNHQFGPGRLDVLKESELCVPSLKETATSPLPTPTPTATFSPPGVTPTPSTTTTTTSTTTTTTTTTSTTSTTLPPGPPPDPGDVAPALDPSVTTDMATATEFLYTGPDHIQRGVAPGAIEPKRAAVVRGLVLMRDGSPLSGVTISILGHPEFGETLTRDDGMFDLAVNGGEPLTVRYEKDDRLPAQRAVDVPWQGFAWAPDVVLVTRDPQVTAITLGAAVPMQVAQGSQETDADGTRRATVLFPAGTTAVMELPGGAVQDLTDLSVRATEYTVGASGPSAMPAPLPPTSGYTYAVELSIDEADAAGAVEVAFNQPVIFHLDNFLGFPAGETVPTGFYDRSQGKWVASDSGRVIDILSETAGLADLDTDGDGIADDAATLAGLGVSDDERAALATLYAPGQSLWRVLIDHFSPWDHNWAFAPPADADFPGQPGPRSPNGPNRRFPSDDPCTRAGSIIECQNQILGERIPLIGTPFSLNYRSDRVRGRSAAFSVEIPLSGPAVPASLKRIELHVFVAGQRHSRVFPAAPNQSHLFTWDGNDAYGRMLQGTQKLRAVIGYVYDGVYERTERFGFSGQGMITGDRARTEVTLTQQLRAFVGNWRALGQGLGGWTIDVHHAYDPSSAVLYLGTGERRGAANVRTIGISTGAGGGSILEGDDVLATDSRFGDIRGVTAGPDGSFYLADFTRGTIHRVGADGLIRRIAGNFRAPNPTDGANARSVNIASPWGLAVAADGSVYYAESNRHHVRKILPDGTVWNVAGSGIFTGPFSGRFGGDGGPATDANLSTPSGIAFAPDGTLYIADALNHAIRRVGTDGIITTFAGRGSSGDGGPATAASLNRPRGVAVGPGGSIYIADTFNHRIRRVGTDGIISTVAGTGVAGFSGDGGPATAAQLNNPEGVFVRADGTLYIGDTSNHRVRVVSPTGIISTFAGSGVGGFGGDGGPPTAALLNFPSQVWVAPDATVYIGDAQNERVRRVTSPMPGFSGGDLAVASDDGAFLYQFSPSGRHLRTLNTFTGASAFEFFYDAAGRLVEVRDGDGNSTTVERDVAGNPTTIVAPAGQRTTLALDGQGYLARVENPAAEATQFTYTADGLMTTMVKPEGQSSQFAYDALGRFEREDDPAGGFVVFNRTEDPDGSTVTATTAEGRVTSYQTESLPGGGERRVTGLPSGLLIETTIKADGARTATFPDGSESSLALGPDPRFGMQAPVAEASSMTTPGGLTSVVTRSRAVVLADPGDPLSLQSLTETVTDNGRTSLSTFDAPSRTLTTRSALGREVVSTLDPQNRVTEVQVAGLAPVAFTYDAQGRLATITETSATETRTSSLGYDAAGSIGSLTDALGQTANLAYDPAARLTSTERPDGGQTALVYDRNGNLTSVAPPGRPVHSFTHTPVDLRESHTAPSVGVGSTRTDFTYDADQQLASISRPAGQTIGLAYDAAGRLDSTTTLPGGAVTDYSYDPVTGQLSGIVAPDGGSIAYSYDGPLLTQVSWAGTVAGSVRSTYRDDFRPASRSVNGAHTAVFDYDGDGLLTQAGAMTLARDPDNGIIIGTTLGNVTTTQSYSPFAEKDSELVEFAGTVPATELFDVSYVRDGLGRITEKTETVGGATTVFGYAYDTAGRLTDVTEGGTNVAHYEYDDNGNRLSRTDPVGIVSGTYDDQDRLLTYGGTTYQYTAAGFLDTKTTGGQVTTYSYDGLGNLVGVSLPGGTQVDYIVDGRSRRIGKRVGGTLVQGLLYKDQLFPVAELDGTGAVASRFVYASHLNVPDYMIKGGNTYRIVSDQLGSPRLVIDTATGAVAERIDYDEFGRVIADTSPGFQPFGFAGGIYDQDTGLVHFGAREYDPETGRWTARDPILFSGGDTNLYGYALNDPVNFGDPSGRILPQVLGGAIGFAAGAIQASLAGEDAAGILRAGLIGGVAGVISTIPIPGLGAVASSVLTGAFAGGFGRVANTLLSTGCLPSAGEVAVSAAFGGLAGKLGVDSIGSLGKFNGGLPKYVGDSLSATSSGLFGANFDAFTDDIVAGANEPGFLEFGGSGN